LTLRRALLTEEHLSLKQTSAEVNTLGFGFKVKSSGLDLKLGALLCGGFNCGTRMSFDFIQQ